MKKYHVMLLLLAGSLNAVAQTGPAVCGDPFHNHFGPFDYRAAKAADIDIVERRHFTPGVESFTQKSTGYFGGDIAYTLHVFPNHPRALVAMMRLGERERTERPRNASYTVACYFDRALRFRPEDGQVRMIYATYLQRKGRNKESLEQLEMARKLSGDSGNLHYNIGLVYFSLKNYEQSLQHAHWAYALGFDLPGLKAKLERVGQWREATPEELAEIRQAVMPAEEIDDSVDADSADQKIN